MTVYITGDKHGSVNEYINVIERLPHATEDDVIIVCGDAGLEYGGNIMGSCKKVMKKFPGTWLILRGNHDTRYWRDHFGLGSREPQEGWDISVKFGDLTLYQEKYSNIHYLLDEGGLYTIEDYKYLMIPGAFSVDGDYRVANHYPYEWEEQLAAWERNELLDAVHYAKNIHFVCGHTFPHSQMSNLQHLFMDFIDQEKVDKTMECFIEGIMLDVEERPEFKHYFGGHYHSDQQIDKLYTVLRDGIIKIENGEFTWLESIR